MLGNIRQLLDEQQYASAAQLCSLAFENDIAGNRVGDAKYKYDVAMLMGQALVGQRHLRRAHLAYKNALELHTMHVGGAVPVALREQLAKTCIDIGGAEMYSEALEHILEIPTASRSLHATMQLAHIYKCRNMSKLASDTYLAALQTNPYCLEAISGYMESVRAALVEQNVREGVPLWNQTIDNLKKTYECENELIHRWIHMQHLKLTANHETMVLATKRLHTENNVYVKTDVAECYYRMGRHVEAAHLFKRCRSIDPFYPGGMDVYSTLLRNLGSYAELQSLAGEMLACAPDAPESWIIASVARSLKGDTDDTSTQYATRALEKGPTFHRSYSYMASKLLAAGQTEAAISYYLQARSYHRDVPVYQGLVRAYIQDKNGRAALDYAKEATHLFPYSSPALALVGHVYRGMKKAKQARETFMAALKLDPQSTDAHIALADLDIEDGRPSQALSRLKSITPSESIHLHLASIYASLGQFSASRIAYEQALKLNKNSVRAEEGLRKLQEREAAANDGR